MRDEEVSLKNLAGEKLVGLEHSPDIQSSNCPAVLLVHGFYGDMDEWGMFKTFARLLTNKGFLVYRFDLSGCGRSEGDYSKTTLTKLAEDVRSILDFIKKRPAVDRRRLGLVGFSLGTSTILALRPRDVKCLVFIGSVAHPYELLQLLFGEGFHPGGVSSRVTSKGQRVEMGPAFWADFQRHNLPRQMSKLKAPILFLHGEKDNVVPLREAEILLDAAAEPKELVLTPEDGHNLTNSLAGEQLTSWFEKYLK